MRVVFWQNCVSQYQATLVKGLSEIAGTEIIWTVEHEGWRSYWDFPDVGRAQLIVKPSSRTAEALLNEDESNSLHIFSMHHHPKGLPIIFGAFRKCLAGRSRMAFLGEGTAWEGRMAFFRMAFDFYDRIRWKNRIGFILAQGDRGIKWFQKCGYPDRMIFPFGFFVERMKSNIGTAPEPNADSCVIVFIGACIFRKGLDLLLNALHKLKHLNWKLLIIGDGDRRSELELLCQSMGIASKVSFLGTLPNEQARSILSASDVLVLPSRSESWGVVVNEALLSGVPVICSDRCGARVLLGRPELGDVIDIDSLEQFREVLSRHIQGGKRTPEMTALIKGWSSCIEREAIAMYVINIIEWAYSGGSRPAPPWNNARGLKVQPD